MTTIFYLEGDLHFFLRGRWKGSKSVTISLERRASIKDVLESFGLPHTEVGSIQCDGEELDFNLIIEEGNRNIFTVFPVQVPWNVSLPTLLRPLPLQSISFLVDVNVGRLARYLRAAGFDTLYDHRWNDKYISELLHRENRILLTRDTRLLMRKHVEFGRYIRETNPAEQLKEVITLFGLAGQLAPFSRCLDCNTPLHEVAKEDVLQRLEPLTKKYYSSFSRCAQCDKIYWHGSHMEKMQRLFSNQLDPT